MKKTKEKEHYLKEIFRLEELDKKASVSILSKTLKVSKSSISNMIKKLVLMELVDSAAYKPIRLTKEGRLMAQTIVAKHRLIESFLVEVMNFCPKEVHNIAEEIEHVDSPAFFRKIKLMVKQNKIDPHGSNIPQIDF
tara:strand:- start:1107 stop:1517 length:411 start_codon:yes stop_codon:yes gene_type:complete